MLKKKLMSIHRFHLDVTLISSEKVKIKIVYIQFTSILWTLRFGCGLSPPPEVFTCAREHLQITRTRKGQVRTFSCFLESWRTSRLQENWKIEDCDCFEYWGRTFAIDPESHWCTKLTHVDVRRHRLTLTYKKSRHGKSISDGFQPRKYPLID